LKPGTEISFREYATCYTTEGENAKLEKGVVPSIRSPTVREGILGNRPSLTVGLLTRSAFCF